MTLSNFAIDLLQSKKQDSYKRNPFKRYNIIILGSSRVQNAIDPSTLIFNDLKILNYSYPYESLGPEYLNSALDKINLKSKIKVIIFPFRPAFLSRHKNSPNRFKKSNKTKNFKFIINYYENLLKLYFPSWINNFSLNNTKIKKVRIIHFNGWTEVPEHVKVNHQLTISEYMNIKNTSIFHEEEFHKIIRIIKNYQDIGIKFYTFPMIGGSEVTKLENQISGWNENFIKSKLLQNGIKYIDIDYSEISFFDGDHVKSNDAKNITKQIRKYIINDLQSDQ
jgi:hypothetical protein